jgi:hypothetical protein
MVYVMIYLKNDSEFLNKIYKHKIEVLDDNRLSIYIEEDIQMILNNVFNLLFIFSKW